jgi:hypothetical protein
MDDLDDVRAHIAHRPKYTASARDLAALASRAREHSRRPADRRSHD